MADAQVIRLHGEEPQDHDAEVSAAVDEPPLERPSSGWERAAAQSLAFLRRRITGDYDVDEFGFDAELTEAAVLPATRQLYRTWFRTEVTGVHNLPAETGALVVANHAGALWALDGVMTATAQVPGTPFAQHPDLLPTGWRPMCLDETGRRVVVVPVAESAEPG